MLQNRYIAGIPKKQMKQKKEEKEDHAGNKLWVKIKINLIKIIEGFNYL